jgi:hypothetical protein
MIKELRERFNNSFTSSKYESFLGELNSVLKYPADFRIAETPIFIPDDLKIELLEACDELISEINSEKFKQDSVGAVPNHLNVPNESTHPEFLQIDFAVCTDSEGKLTPRLIELQGFPSLYAYQYYLARLVKKHFPIPDNFDTYFSSLSGNDYVEIFKRTILGECSPENVILLEIEPELQKTKIDFSATEELVGIKTVCISDIIKRGKNLFYKSDNREIKIKRIYNRVIFDELERKNLKYNFDFRDELDVKWVCHPNWFFRISKYSLPLFKSRYAPECYYLNSLEQYPDDIHNYVLKPLFSFAGLGVEVELTKSRLDKISDRENYILQKKIEYSPVIKTPDEFSKAEIRMMFIWNEKPILVNNLVRLSKGKMMGVDFNKNKTWVGSSAGFHQQ